MKLRRRSFLRLVYGAAALPFVSRLARADTYPNKALRLIVGFPAGGQVDITARLAAQWLGERLGQTVVVENKPGAGGNLGAQALINSPPDGYTLFFAAASNTVNTTLFANLPYDFARDTVPVGPINRIPLVLEVNPGFEAKTVAAFIAYAKANPGKLSVGSPSAGTPPYLCVELLKMMTGIDVVHVPYVGENQMVTDLLGGQLMAGFGGISSGIGHIKADKLRALGVTTAARDSGIAQRAGRCRDRPGFRGQRLERHRGAERHVRGDCRKTRRRDCRHPGRSEIQGTAQRFRRAVVRAVARRIRQVHRRRDREVGQGGEVRRTEAAITEIKSHDQIIARGRLKTSLAGLGR